MHLWRVGYDGVIPASTCRAVPGGHGSGPQLLCSHCTAPWAGQRCGQDVSVPQKMLSSTRRSGAQGEAGSADGIWLQLGKAAQPLGPPHCTAGGLGFPDKNRS